MTYFKPLPNNPRFGGFDPRSQEFEYHVARPALPWRAGLAWSAIAGLACLLVLTFGAGL